MANDYYSHGSYPATGASGDSASMRAELDSIETGFGKLPSLSGNGNKAVIVNAGGTALSVTTGTLSLAGNLATTGAFNTTFAQQATVTLTLPSVTGTLALTTDAVTNISGGSAGVIPYQSAASTTGFSAAGSAGQALLSGGAGSPTWTTGTLALAGNLAFTGANNVVFATVGNYTYTLPTSSGTLGLQGGGGGAADSIAGGAAGQVLWQSALDTTGFTAAGTSGQVLVSGGTGSPTWTTGTLSLAGNLATTGAFNTTFAQTATVTLTLPGSSQTLATLAGNETLSGKTLTTPTISATGWSNANHNHSSSSRGGTIATSDLTGHTRAAHDALGTGNAVYTSEAQTLSAKTLSSPTINTPTIPAAEWSNATHTHAGATTGGQIATSNLTGHDRAAHDALGTGSVVYTNESQTLASKTLTAPIISSISNTGTITLPTSTGTAALLEDFQYQLKNGAYTAVDGDYLACDTSTAAFTVTLPVSPSAGDAVRFMDAEGTFASKNLTIARNGQTIMGAASDFTVNTNNASFGLLFIGSDWRLI